MACNCEKEIAKFAWILEDETNDQVNSIGGGAYGGTTVANLVAQNPQFWLEADSNGTNRLCTSKTLDSALDGTFWNAAIGPYTRKAVLFDTILFGGHPTHRPPTR